jgi:hypothetical protein
MNLRYAANTYRCPHCRYRYRRQFGCWACLLVRFGRLVGRGRP